MRQRCRSASAIAVSQNKNAGSLHLYRSDRPVRLPVAGIDRSRSHDAVIRVYDDAGNVIETHEHKGDFKEW